MHDFRGPRYADGSPCFSIHISDQTSIWLPVTWAPPRWWWSSERYAREGMRETQRQRRDLVARGVSKAAARRLVPRMTNPRVALPPPEED